MLEERGADSEGMIERDCSVGFKYCASNSKKRQILSPSEADKVMKVQWDDERNKLANQIAMTTGMRSGEILALTLSDIGTDRIYIRHAWGREDGLKCPKNGEVREVKLLPALRDALIKHGLTNPHEEGPGFIFYSSIPSKPMEPRYWRQSLRKACKAAGLTNFEDIDFHSWRHYFTTVLKSKVSADTLKKSTGHKSDKMLNHYSDHVLDEDFTIVAKAVEEQFGGIV